MNVFGLDIENLDSDLIREAVSAESIGVDWLPGIPAILTREECAAVASVSLPTIDRLVQAGTLSEVNGPGSDSGILKRDLIAYIQANFLANRPIIDDLER